MGSILDNSINIKHLGHDNGAAVTWKNVSAARAHTEVFSNEVS